MRLTSGYEERKARIEMLPLIDIVFLLLVFFIYAMLSMTVHRGLVVELPAASMATEDTREYVSLTITKENEIYLDRRRISLDSLVAEVNRAMEDDKERPVFVHGDIHADLGIAIAVLDMLRSAGISQVSFQCSERIEP